MDKNVLKIMEMKIERLKKACELANFECIVLDRKEELIPLLNEMIGSNQSCSVGGSETLFETGVISYLENRQDIVYLDRYHAENRDDIFKQTFSCDVYLTSTNALTLKAELYNVDGTGNRVAAMIYGPKRVFVIAGINKLVNDLDEAIERVKSIAAPANCARLNKENPCTQIGHCVDCRSATRICGASVTISHALKKGRMHIILIKEELGY